MAKYPHNISPNGFIALTWAGFGVATFFVFCRGWIRFRILDRFGWPDLWIVLAFFTLLIGAIVQTCATSLLYDIVEQDENRTKVPSELREERRAFARYFITLTLLFLTTLWAVKAAFLALFRPLFEGMRVMKLWWTAISIFTGLLCFGCLLPPVVISVMSRKGSRDSSKVAAKTETAIILFAAVADIVSDLIIAALPIRLLWRVRLSPSQKWGLSAVFGVSGITIITAIVRATQVGDVNHSDLVWLFVWGVIETSTAVTVGCLPSFKALIQPPTRSQTYYVFTSNVRASSARRKNASDPSLHPLEQSRSWYRAADNAEVGIDDNDGCDTMYPGRIPTFAPDTKTGTMTSIHRGESLEDILSPGSKARMAANGGMGIAVHTEFDIDDGR